MNQDQPSRGTRKWLVAVAKLLIVVLVVWAIRRTLYDALTQLGEHPWRLKPLWLLAAGGLYLIGLLPCAFFWHRILLALGQHVQLRETLRAYYIGHLGKYVPGKAMVVVIRVGMIRSRQVAASVAAVSVFFETLTMMAVGAFVAAAILATRFREQQFLFLVAVGLMVAAGLPTFPPIFKRLVRALHVSKLDPSIAEKLENLGLGTLLMGWVSIGIGWGVMGLSLWAVLQSMGVSDLEPVGQLPLYTASVSLAMVAGFLSLIPGGAVVREAVLTQLMVPCVGQLAALAAAILLRIVWLVSEMTISGILYFVGTGGLDEGRGARGEG